MASKNNGKFPNRLRELRRNAGLSQKEIAEAIGIGQSGYSSMESGSVELMPSRIEKLCKLFNCSKKDLYPPTVDSVLLNGNLWTCTDDSMAPKLMVGDIVSYKEVDDWHDVPNESVVLVCIKGDMTTREFVCIDDVIYLTPNNPQNYTQYKIYLTPSNSYTSVPISLIGVCTQYTRKL